MIDYPIIVTNTRVSVMFQLCFSYVRNLIGCVNFCNYDYGFTDVCVQISKVIPLKRIAVLTDVCRVSKCLAPKYVICVVLFSYA